GRNLGADRDRPARRAFSRAPLRHLQQRAKDSFTQGVDIAAAVAEVRIFETGKGRVDAVECSAHGPLRAETLLADETARLAHQLRALEHEPVDLDDVVPLTAVLLGQVLLQTFELPIGGHQRALEACDLRGDLVRRDAALADDDTDVQCIRGTDSDPLRRPDSLAPFHLVLVPPRPPNTLSP